LTSHIMASAQEFLGSANVHELPIRMTAEDFSYYTHHVSGCFYRLGVASIDKSISSPVHTSTFDIDERALMTGPSLMAWLAISRLSALGG